MNHLEIGQLGEEIALNFMKNKGYKALDQNYSKKFGEIDLVFSKKDIIYFVEVKTMSGDFDRDILIEKIHKNKISRLKKAIHSYLLEKNILDKKWRLSAILISVNSDTKKSQLEFIENLW